MCKPSIATALFGSDLEEPSLSIPGASHLPKCAVALVMLLTERVVASCDVQLGTAILEDGLETVYTELYRMERSLTATHAAVENAMPQFYSDMLTAAEKAEFKDNFNDALPEHISQLMDFFWLQRWCPAAWQGVNQAVPYEFPSYGAVRLPPAKKARMDLSSSQAPSSPAPTELATTELADHAAADDEAEGISEPSTKKAKISAETAEAGYAAGSGNKGAAQLGDGIQVAKADAEKEASAAEARAQLVTAEKPAEEELADGWRSPVSRLSLPAMPLPAAAEKAEESSEDGDVPSPSSQGEPAQDEAETAAREPAEPVEPAPEVAPAQAHAEPEGSAQLPPNSADIPVEHAAEAKATPPPPSPMMQMQLTFTYNSLQPILARCDPQSIAVRGGLFLPVTHLELPSFKDTPLPLAYALLTPAIGKLLKAHGRLGPEVQAAKPQEQAQVSLPAQLVHCSVYETTNFQELSDAVFNNVVRFSDAIKTLETLLPKFANMCICDLWLADAQGPNQGGGNSADSKGQGVAADAVKHEEPDRKGTARNRAF